jgi:hypothetical protein
MISAIGIPSFEKPNFRNLVVVFHCIYCFYIRYAFCIDTCAPLSPAASMVALGSVMDCGGKPAASRNAAPSDSSRKCAAKSFTVALSAILTTFRLPLGSRTATLVVAAPSAVSAGADNVLGSKRPSVLAHWPCYPMMRRLPKTNETIRHSLHCACPPIPQ